MPKLAPSEENRISSYQHIGETCGCVNQDRDLIHELSRRLDSLWRCDQYLANAQGMADLEDFWRSIKQQESENVQQLTLLLKKQFDQNCC